MLAGIGRGCACSASPAASPGRDGLGLRLLQDMTARMDLTVVDTRTGRIVAVGGPILGQLQVDPDAVQP
jgi:hypothetical protein